MTPATDPYRILGLDPGATPAEIKRAYRRLAKAYHPDSAGERALPRFLAIQAAYERLTDSRPGGSGATGRDGASRRGTGQGQAAPPPGRPWSADAERARATREGFRQRTARSGTRPTGAAGATGTSSGPGPGGGTGPGRRGGTAGASGGADAAAGTRPGGGRGSGRRGRSKATIGSTSYDGTENEPFEPGWSGATWYGAASGTYWTINPKEYADPRKHGPEYLARAQRIRRSGAGSDDPAGSRPVDADPIVPAGRAEEGGAGPGGAPAPARAEPGPVPPAGADLDSDSPPAASGSEGAPSPPSAAPRPTSTTSAGLRPRRTQPAAPKPPVPPMPAPARSLVRFRAVDPARVLRSWRGRIVLVALAWFPIGLAIFGIHGQVTGCAQFMASCTDPIAWSVWIPQLIVVALLLASPRLAWIAASGSILLLCAAIPLAAALTAGSGGRPPSAATTQLLYAAMTVGWLAGVAIALSGRIPLPPWRTARVR